MNGNATEARYDPLTVRLHWATAVLVLLLWGSAQIVDLFPKGAPRWNMRSVHMVLGLTLLAVLAVRLRWRAGGGRRLPSSSSARLVHRLLYALMLGTVGLGLLNPWVRGDHVFEWFQLPVLSLGIAGLRGSVGTLHEWGANALLALAGGHALMALIHHHVLKDSMLRRMGFEPSPPANRP